MSTQHMQQFGGWLRHAREARGLSVDAVASQTKIPSRHLQALERGDRVALPAFYQRAEVRAVARAVGIDEQLAVARMEAELAPVEPAPLPAPPTSTRVPAHFVLAMIGVFAVVVGLAGWGTFERTTGREDAVEQPKPAAAPPTTPTLPAREVPGVPTIETVAAEDPAPVVPVGPTELVIQTQPEGARVTVNGVGWGEAPVAIRHLEPGEKRIRVTMDGYAATERSVTVDEGRRATIRVRLSRVAAGL